MVAEVKISALPAITAVAVTDLFPDVQGGVTYKSTVTQLITCIQSNLGTVTSGVWHGSVIPSQYGGTDNSSYTIGDILFASGATTLSKLSDIATGNSLISGGVGTAPSWGKIGLTTHVSGILPIGNGGLATGSTPTNGQIPIGNGTNYTLSTLTAGTGISIANSSGSVSLSTAGSNILSPVKAFMNNPPFGTVIYSNGTLGVGATITSNTNGSLGATDGVTLAPGDAFFFYYSTSPEMSGVYLLTSAGSVGTPWSATRRTDFDTSSKILSGSQCYILPIQAVGGGLSTNNNFGGSTLTCMTNNPTVGTTGIYISCSGKTFFSTTSSSGVLQEVMSIDASFGNNKVSFVNGSTGNFDGSDGVGFINVYPGSTVRYAVNCAIGTATNGTIALYGSVSGATSIKGWVGTPDNIPLGFFVNGGSSGPTDSVGHFATSGSFNVGPSATPTFSVTAAGLVTGGTYNKVSITAPATSATLTLADGSSHITVGAFASTFTFTNTTGVTFPTSGTLATTSQLYTGNLSISVRNVLFDQSTNYTYNNGTLGFGATLTHTSNGALVTDGITNSVGDLIFALLGSNSAQGGVYSATDVGSAGTPYILTRVANFDTASEMLYGTVVNVSQGTSWQGVNFSLFNSITTVGTTAFQWNITGEMTGDFGIKSANVLNNLVDCNVSAGRVSIHGGTTVPSAIGPELSNSALEVYNVINKYGIVTFDSSSAGIWGTYAGTEAWTGSISNVAIRFFVNGGTGGPSTSVGHFTTAGTFGVGTFASPPFSVTSSGVVTGGTYNKVTITSPASSATLTLADGSSHITVGAFSSTFTFTNTTTVAFPTTGTLATLAGSESLSNKTLVSPVISTGLTASGSAANDFSASTGTFITSTGANTLSGAVTINDATTPSLTTAAGKTNTGFLQVNGKTSGALKVTVADATAQTITLTVAAQTVGAATLTIPNMANTNKTIAWLESPTFTTPVLGVASATSLATSAATPLLLTNGQLVNIALTSQTTGATTLTIPDFAGVVDEFTFKTKSQTMSNKTFVAPLLGTPTSGTLTNCTGYPVANIANLGSGVATFLATPSSANLAAAVTDETGTAGSVVFSISPSFTGTSNFTSTAAINTNFSGTQTAGGGATFQSGLQINPTHSCSGAIDNVQSVRLVPTWNPAGGTIGTAAGYYVFPITGATGTITTSFAMNITGGSSGGATVGSAYGLNVNTPLFGSTKYTAYFDSGVGIGALNPTSTGVDLLVNGILAVGSTGNGNRFNIYSPTTSTQCIFISGGNTTQTGSFNIGAGISTLSSLTSGARHTAYGIAASQGVSSLDDCAAFGYQANRYSSGAANTAVGSSALLGVSGSSTGGNNCAFGNSAGSAITSGSNNIFIGSGAGTGISSNSNNIIINGQLFSTNTSAQITIGYGANTGVSVQTKCFIDGIASATAGAGTAVVVTATGQLIPLASAERFKKNIVDMNDFSSAIYDLTPRCFELINPDFGGFIEPGLIAEEVEKTALKEVLVGYQADGQTQTVHYYKLSVLLLNELQKLQNRVAALEGKS